MRIIRICKISLKKRLTSWNGRGFDFAPWQKEEQRKRSELDSRAPMFAPQGATGSNDADLAGKRNQTKAFTIGGEQEGGFIVLPVKWEIKQCHRRNFYFILFFWYLVPRDQILMRWWNICPLVCTPNKTGRKSWIYSQKPDDFGLSRLYIYIFFLVFCMAFSCHTFEK